MSAPESAAKLGKSEVVYRQLKEEISSGERAPGTALTEAKIVMETGASRTPVREALRRLAAEGLVEITPRIGAKVAPISLRSVRELFDYRRVLEPAAIAMVVEATAQHPEILEPFQALAEGFRELRGHEFDDDFVSHYRELASEFDLTMISCTPNDHLARAIRELRPHTARVRQIAHAERDRLDGAIQEHLDMAGHIIAGNGPAAAAALTEHLRNVEGAIFKALMRSGQGSRSASVDIVV